jgi:hypothetical protein
MQKKCCFLLEIAIYAYFLANFDPRRTIKYVYFAEFHVIQLNTSKSAGFWLQLETLAITRFYAKKSVFFSSKIVIFTIV